jgi:hypothetical protein
MARSTLELNGYGDGDGYGYGYGSGDGSGYGYGYGDGDGSGYGDGDGYGYGDGDGYGYGYGYGDGSGSGSGDSKNNDSYFSALLSPHQRGKDRVVMFWRSRADGAPANGGGSKTKARVGLTEEIPGPLALCTSRALHACMDPTKWKGERWWIVALHKPVVFADDKAGSLKRTFLVDLGKCPFN